VGGADHAIGTDSVLSMAKRAAGAEWSRSTAPHMP
jgi:hypothetical protein